MLMYWVLLVRGLWGNGGVVTLGKRAERLVAMLMELAEMFTPMLAIKNAKAQKKAAALPPYTPSHQPLLFYPFLSSLQLQRLERGGGDETYPRVQLSKINNGSHSNSPNKIFDPFAPIIPNNIIITINTISIKISWKYGLLGFLE